MELSKAHFRTMPDAECKQLFIEFVKQVRSMRDMQKEYFKTRNLIVLRNAQKAEKDIDALIVRLFEDENLELF